MAHAFAGKSCEKPVLAPKHSDDFATKQSFRTYLSSLTNSVAIREVPVNNHNIIKQSRHPALLYPYKMFLGTRERTLGVSLPVYSPLSI